jgi:hypothetical protein
LLPTLFFCIIEYRSTRMKKIYPLFIFIIYGNLILAQLQIPTANPNFFPIGVWLQQPSHALAYKKAGVNMYVGLWDGLDQAQLTDLKKAGMKVVCDQNTFALSILSDTTIYGWTQSDEPDNAQWNATANQYDPCIAPSVIINTYNAIKAKDPSRPVYLNLGQGVSNIDWVGRGTCTGKTDMYPVYNNGYVKASDIISFDIYPVNNTDVTSGKLWYVPKGVDSLQVWAEGKKPVWCWIEVTKIDNKTSKRQPTPEEVKAEVWMALIHGATGFGYFCHSWKPTLNDAELLSDATMLAAVTGINTEIGSLAPVLNSASTKGYASVSSSNTAVPIDIMTKNYGLANYIFSVGMRPGITTASFTVSAGNKVEVIGENRTLTIAGGKFSDDFASYGVHLYKITTDPNAINEHNSNDQLTLYPNPVAHELFVELNSAIKNMSYEIFDVVGRKITAGNLQDNRIAVSGLSKGSYVIVFADAKGDTAIRKFFKD